MCHSQWEQSFNMVTVNFDVKKVKETLVMWLSGNLITERKTSVTLEKFLW